MKASKNNKEYMIHESQEKFYQEAGYDILDDDGKIILYGRGKTVPYEDYIRACNEVLGLRVRVKELEAAIKAQSTKEEPVEEEPVKEEPVKEEPVREEPEKGGPEKKTASKKAGG